MGDLSSSVDKQFFYNETWYGALQFCPCMSCLVPKPQGENEKKIIIKPKKMFVVRPYKDWTQHISEN